MTRAACIVLVAVYLLTRIVVPGIGLHVQIKNLPSQQTDVASVHSQAKTAALTSLDDPGFEITPSLIRVLSSSPPTGLVLAPAAPGSGVFAGTSAPLRI